jgi:hypothetical protein
MAAIMAWFSGKKTYFIVILGVLVVLVHFLSGDLTLMQFIASDEFVKLLELLGLGTIRAGVSKIQA